MPDADWFGSRHGDSPNIKLTSYTFFPDGRGKIVPLNEQPEEFPVNLFELVIFK